MKKFSKVCLIIVGVLLGIGILLCGISSLMGAGMGTIRQMANAGELNRGNWHINSHGIYYSDNNDNDVDFDWDDDTDDIDVEVGDIDVEVGDVENSKKSDKTDGGAIVSKYAVSDIKKMDLDIGAVTLIIKTGEDAEHVVVTMKEGEDRYYDVGMDGNTLEIEYKIEHKTWLFDYDGNDELAELMIEIPAGMKLDKMDLDIGAADVAIDVTDMTCGKLVMDVGAANVVANGFNVTELLDATVGVGSLEIGGGTYEKANIECGVGNFEMSGTVNGDLTVDCGLGNAILKLNGNEDDYNYKLSCGMGSLVVNDTQYTDIAGNHNVKNEGAIGTIDLDCGMGNLELEIK